MEGVHVCPRDAGKEGSIMVTRAMWISTLLLGLVAGTGFAAEVDFVDLNEGLIVTTKNIVVGIPFFSPESAVVTAQLPLTSMPTGGRQVILTEPSSPTVSDLVVLDAEAGPPGAAFESIRIEFDSDTDSPLVPSPTIPVVGTIPETGMTQDLTSLLQSGSVTITAVSDVETPLPASAWSGLALFAGLATWRTVRHVKHTRA